MDDDAVIQEILGEMLEFSGYAVEIVSDGQQAVEVYRQAMANGQPFAAVIADLTVPGRMGGKEMVAELLKIDPEAKVIVSSGYSSDPVMANFADYGFKAVIAKPYKMEELRKHCSGCCMVRSMISRPKSQESSAKSADQLQLDDLREKKDQGLYPLAKHFNGVACRNLQVRPEQVKNIDNHGHPDKKLEKETEQGSDYRTNAGFETFPLIFQRKGHFAAKSSGKCPDQ